jgi:hypothetical protein
MNTRTLAVVALIMVCLIGSSGVGLAYYAGTTSVEDNAVDTQYSLMYISDSTGDSHCDPGVLLSNIPSSVTAEQISQGYTFDAASDGDTHYYLVYRDTNELTGTPAPSEPGTVHGDRSIIALQVFISGLSDLNGSTVTLKIGGSTTTSVISEGSCTIVGNSFSTVDHDGDERSQFIGRVSLVIAPYSAGSIDSSSASLEMTAYHTELTATGQLKVSAMSTTGSSGQYTTTSGITYANSPATGSDLAVLRITATYDSTWYADANDRGAVTAVLKDSVRGTSVSQTCYIDSGYGWTVALPVKLSGGAFYGSLQIYSEGKDSSSTSPHSLSGGDPASITLTMLETTAEVVR